MSTTEYVSTILEEKNKRTKIKKLKKN